MGLLGKGLLGSGYTLRFPVISQSVRAQVFPIEDLLLSDMRSISVCVGAGGHSAVCGI